MSKGLISHSVYCWSGPKLEQLMEELRTEMSTNPPLPGAYTPKKGDICAARYSEDKQWYLFNCCFMFITPYKVIL